MVESFDLRHTNPTLREAFGHLQPQVAGAHDQRRLRSTVFDASNQRETVSHRVEQVHSVGLAQVIQPHRWRPNRNGAGGDDQLVIYQCRLIPVAIVKP